MDTDALGVIPRLPDHIGPVSMSGPRRVMGRTSRGKIFWGQVLPGQTHVGAPMDGYRCIGSDPEDTGSHRPSVHVGPLTCYGEDLSC